MATYRVLRKYFGFKPSFPKWYKNKRDNRTRAVECACEAMREDKKYYVAWAIEGCGKEEVRERAHRLRSGRVFIDLYMRPTVIANGPSGERTTLLEYAMVMSGENEANKAERKHHTLKKSLSKQVYKRD